LLEDSRVSFPLLGFELEDFVLETGELVELMKTHALEELVGFRFPGDFSLIKEGVHAFDQVELVLGREGVPELFPIPGDLVEFGEKEILGALGKDVSRVSHGLEEPVEALPDLGVLVVSLRGVELVEEFGVEVRVHEFVELVEEGSCL